MIKYCVSEISGLEVYLPALFTQTMQALTGQTVKIIFGDSPAAGSLGSLTRAQDGGLVVHISPSMTLDAILSTFLHEAAHVRLHAPRIAKSDISTRPAESFDDRPTLQASPALLAAKDQREEEARELQAAWLDYAERNAWKVTYNAPRYEGMNPIVYKLLILQNYYSQERATK